MTSTTASGTSTAGEDKLSAVDDETASLNETESEHRKHCRRNARQRGKSRRHFTALKKTLERSTTSPSPSFMSDMCSVMKGTREVQLLKFQAKVIDIHCICHLISLSFAVKALPIKVNELLVDIFYHLC